MSEQESPNEPRNRRRKEARPGEIIEAGLQEFAEHGFAGARMGAIARRAGIVKGTIYRYFDSKEALFEAAVRAKVVVTLDEIEARIDGFPGRASDMIGLLVETLYKRFVTNPELRTLLQIMVGEGQRFPELTELYHREIITKGRRIMTWIIKKGVDAGEFRKGPASSQPTIMMAPALMAAIWQITFERHEHLSLEDFQQAHLDLLLNGLLQSRV